jgi:Zn-dependent protease with chaperone function
VSFSRISQNISPKRDKKMIQTQVLSRNGLQLLLICLAVSLVIVAPGLSETLNVERPDMQLYESPDFTSPSLGSVPVGEQVEVISRSGDWVQVEYEGETGWLHKLAFLRTKVPTETLKLETTAPVRETTRDEVVLAGKGFTPEIEKGYRQENPNLNYAQVDEIESFRMNPTQMRSFLTEGKLNYLPGSKALTATQEFSDSDEYYLGRAVAANILAEHPLYQNQAVTRYVNLVGQAVAQKYSKSAPRGFHFAVLDNPEPNAFACPGGIIFVTRGLIKNCQNEEELAAVLAHEVSHVVHQDGVTSIRKARKTEERASAVTKPAKAGAIGPGAQRRKRRRMALNDPTTALTAGGGLAASSIVSIFGDAVKDVIKTIVVNGYSRSAEENADREAVNILAGTGYNPAALTTLLNQMISRGEGKTGIWRTHPPTSDRLARVKSFVVEAPAGPGEQARTKRFHQIAL